MRTMLILLLTLLLLAAAFITRPGKREFVLHLLDSPGTSAAPWSPAAVSHAEQFGKAVTFRDRWLWTDVEKDGKVIYTGLFSHWLPRGERLEKAVPNPADLSKVLAAVKSN